MRAGDTFTFADPRVDNHLWVVISEPMLDVADPVVIINFTTYREGKDRSCVLQPGEHPFIRHETVVHYAGAMNVPNAKLEGLANGGKVVLQGQVRPDVLDRIRQGAAESPFIREGCRRMLVKQGLIEP
jgi:hypothetical protein